MRRVLIWHMHNLFATWLVYIAERSLSHDMLRSQVIAEETALRQFQ